MTQHQELIKRAIDTNALSASVSTGTAINPSIWDQKLREFEEQSLIVTPLCESYDFTGPGADYSVFVDGTAAAGAALTETVALTITAFEATRKVTFTPTEYGKAYQVSDKEMRRSFFDVMNRITRKLGYSLAVLKESNAVSAARTAATYNILANGAAAASNIASTNTLGLNEILAAARKIETHDYQPVSLSINKFQKEQLLKLSNLNDVSKFGTRDAIAKGVVGELFGITIYHSNSISNDATATSTAKAIMLGKSGSGEGALGYAVKAYPKVASEYDVLGRFWTVAAVEEYNFQALHPLAIVTIQTWSTA
jgi:HK97 family phage major capsid protein